MDLQDIFYLTGIIFFVLSVFLFIGMVIGLFYIRKKIDEIHYSVEEKLDRLYETASKPVKTAAAIADALNSWKKKGDKGKSSR